MLVLAVVALRLRQSADQRADHHDLKSGYRPYLLIPKRVNNDPHTLFVLAFSGVVRAPRRSRTACWKSSGAPDRRRWRRGIDEVDLITGVSGGSFTALAYALYGERLFSEYEQRFLKRDVQGALVSRTLNPFNWWKLSAERREPGARRGVLRRDPVRRRDLRRPARQAGAGRGGLRDRHLDGLAARVLPAGLRPAVLGSEQGPPVARGGDSSAVPVVSRR